MTKRMKRLFITFVTIFLSLSATAQSQSFTIKKTWVNTVQRNGEKVLEVHADMVVRDQKGSTVGVYLYFYDGLKRPLINTQARKEHRAGNNSQVYVSKPVTCTADVSSFYNLVFTIPYNQFPLPLAISKCFCSFKVYKGKWYSGGSTYYSLSETGNSVSNSPQNAARLQSTQRQAQPATQRQPQKSLQRQVVKTWKTTGNGWYNQNTKYNDGWVVTESYWLSPNGWQKRSQTGYLDYIGRYGDSSHNYLVSCGYGGQWVYFNGSLIANGTARDAGSCWIIGKVSISKDFNSIVVDGRTYRKMSDANVRTYVNQMNSIPTPGPIRSYSGGSYGGNGSGSSTNSSGRMCSICNGTGRCSTCGGRGERRLGGDGSLVDCYQCHGSGNCTICYGTGRR